MANPMPLLAPVTRITFFPMLSLIQCVLLPGTPVGLQQRSPLSTGSPSTHTLPFKGSATPGVQLETAKLLQAYVIRNCPFSKTLFALVSYMGRVTFPKNLEQASREFSGIGGRSRTPVPGIILLSCATDEKCFCFSNLSRKSSPIYLWSGLRMQSLPKNHPLGQESFSVIRYTGQRAPLRK